MPTKAKVKFDHVYRWKKNAKRNRLNGSPCRIVAHGSGMHSVLVEFEDGERVVTTVRAVHRRKG